MMRRLFPAQAAKEPGDAGFTLVEMMVVVSIIGILAAIAIPRYMAYAKSSQTAEVGRVAGQIVAAIATLADGQGLAPAAVQAKFDAAALNVDTAPAAANDLTKLIPQFAAPSGTKFNYIVSAIVASAGPQTGEVVYCIQAKGRANSGVTTGGVVAYSSSPTTAASWDSRINRQAFDANQAAAISISAGGYCTTTGTASATYS